MKASICDPAMVLKKFGQELIGMCGTHVDGTIYAGINNYSEGCKCTEK